MTRWTLILAIAALAAMPLATAQAAPQANFTSATVTWDDETRGPGGALVALQNILPTTADLLAPVNQGPVEDSWFELESQSVVVRVVAADAYAENPVFAAPLPPRILSVESPAIHQSESDYTNMVLVGSLSRSDRALYAFPLDGCEALVSAPRGTAAASTITESYAAGRFDNRNDVARDVSQAVELTPASGSDIQLTGCFQVVLWEWDLDWSSAESSGSIWSGKKDAQGALGATVSKAQQVYLIVQDGTFTMRGNAERPTRVFLDSLQVTAPTVSLSDAKGQVTIDSAVVPVEGRQVTLRGDVQLNIGREGSALNVQAGGIHSMDVDGQSMAVASTAAGTSGISPMAWMLGLGVIGLVGVPVTVLAPRAARRHHVQASLDRAQALFQCLRYEDSRAWAAKAVDLAPENPYSHYRLAQALTGLGNPGQALVHHDIVARLLKDHDPELAAENALQAAEAAAGQGDAVTARRWLRHALAAKPDLQDTIESTSPLVNLLRIEASGETPYWLKA